MKERKKELLDKYKKALMGSKLFTAGTVMKVLGMQRKRSTFNTWVQRGVLIATIPAKGAGTQAMYNVGDILTAVVVQKLREIRLDLAIASDIARLSPLYSGSILWYDIETQEHSYMGMMDGLPDRNALLVINIDRIIEEVIQKLDI